MTTFSLQWLGLMLDSTAKSLLLAMIAAVCIRVLQIRNCHVQHRIWIGVLAGMLALPFLTAVIPQLRLPVVTSQGWPRSTGNARSQILDYNSSASGESQVVVPANSLTATAQGPASSEAPGVVPSVPRLPGQRATLDGIENSMTAPDGGPHVGIGLANVSSPELASDATGLQVLRQLSEWLAMLWLAGATVMLARLLLGVTAARKLRRTSLPITSADLQELGVSASCWPSGVQSNELLECPRIRVPLTLGLFRPAVLLPAEWLEWSTQKLQSVLLHERTHVERGDCAVAFLSEVNVAVNWFNPLAWWLRQHLSALAEEACDDAAIAGIGDRTSYAQHLLEVAAAVSQAPGRIIPLGLSMARQSNVELRIDAILDFTRPLSKRPTWATTLAVLILAGPVIALAAALKPGSPQDDSESSSSTTALADASGNQKGEAAIAGTGRTGTAGAGSAAPDYFRYAGTVVDEKGQPVEGASITLNYWRFMNGEGQPAITTTDSKGRFEIKRQISDFQDSSEDRPWTWAQIIATKPGYGFAAAPSVPFETTGQILESLSELGRANLKSEGNWDDRVLKLGADLPIRGRIVDTEGRPVTGAVVEPFNADEGTSGSLDAWEAATKKPGANFYSARSELRRLYGGDFVNSHIDRTLPPAKTDANGVFTLKGVGKERLVCAVLSGPNIESSIIRLRSRMGKTIKLADDERGERFFTYYPTDFTHVAGPSQPVEGIISDLKTGKPIEGVFVRGERTATYNVGGNAGFIRSTTDKDGRFRLEGFPLGENEFVVLPPAKSGYLPAGAEITTIVGPEPLINNVSLTHGIPARGVIKEAANGKPIRGYVAYSAFANNPALQATRNFRGVDQRFLHHIDDQGRFEIPVLPGPGVITFMANDHESFGRGEGADKITAPEAFPGGYAAQPYFVTAVNHHGLIPIEPAVDSESIEVSLTLTRLQSFKGRVLDVNGIALEHYFLFGENAPGFWYEHKSALFEAKGYRSDFGRRLMAYDPKSDRIGLLDVSGNAPAAIEIKLQPASRIVARLVDEDGQPISGVRIENDFGGAILPAPMPGMDLWNGRFDPKRADFVTLHGRGTLTDDDGRFELVGIMPGLKYNARAQGMSKVGNQTVSMVLGSVFSDVVVGPSEKHDLGDVRILAPKPLTQPSPNTTPSTGDSTQEEPKP